MLLHGSTSILRDCTSSALITASLMLGDRGRPSHPIYSSLTIPTRKVVPTEDGEKSSKGRVGDNTSRTQRDVAARAESGYGPVIATKQLRKGAECPQGVTNRIRFKGTLQGEFAGRISLCPTYFKVLASTMPNRQNIAMGQTRSGHGFKTQFVVFDKYRVRALLVLPVKLFWTRTNVVEGKRVRACPARRKTFRIWRISHKLPFPQSTYRT